MLRSHMEVSGHQLRAFLAAFADLRSRNDFLPFQKSIDLYDVIFDDSSESYEVTFIPKRLNNEIYQNLKSPTLGLDVRYCVSKRDFTVTDVSFQR
jgi:hypothetical protein